MVRRASIIDVLMPRAQAALPGPLDDRWYGPPSKKVAGQVVNGGTALTASGCWAATNCIAGLFGQLPAKSYKKIPDGREEATKHPTFNILSREPNPDMDSFVFWEMMSQWWVNYGNAFAEKQFLGDSGQLFALWPIHPSRVKPERDSLKRWTGRWEIKNNAGQPSSYLLDSEMFNIVGALSDDGLIGKGVLTYAAQAIGIALAESGYKGGFYSSDCTPSGVLEHPGKLSDKARAEMRRDWREVHAESNQIAILWEGMKFTKVSTDPENAQLNESQLFSVQEMSRFYDLPPHVLYELSKGTFANVEEMNRFLVSQPFGKRIVRVEKAIDRQLFTADEKKAGYYSKFNVDALLRGNPKEQAEIAAIEIGCGVSNQDEVRARKDQNKIPDGLGAKYWVRRDMAPMDLAIESAKKSLEEPAPTDIGPTAPTPATPPTPDGGMKARLQAYRSMNRALIQKVRVAEQSAVDHAHDAKCASALTDGLIKQKESVELQLADSTSQLVALANERNEIKSTNSGLEDRCASLENRLLAENAACAKANTSIVDLTATLRERDAAIEGSVNEISGVKDTLERERIAFEADKNVLIEAKSAVEVELAAMRERDKNISAIASDKAARVEQLEGELADAAAAHGKLTAQFTTTVRQLENTASRADSAETAVKSLESSISALKSEKSACVSSITLLDEKILGLQSNLNRANDRGDECKSKLESVSIELGAMRAEADGLRVQTKSLTAARDTLSNSLAEAKELAKSTGETLETAQNEVIQVKEEAAEAISGARAVVAASMRTLLDESLQMLLDDEQQWTKEAARKPEQFKEIINGHYHHFGQRLTAQLTQAANALEKLGGNRTDVAKLASDYVADSRTRLNKCFNSTPRDNLRIEVRKEVESWEGRRQTLLNWIGV